MKVKSELLKELGWNDTLIQHFMVDDSGENVGREEAYDVGVFDSRSLTLTINAEQSGSIYLIKG